jgi:hypothetical protein
MARLTRLYTPVGVRILTVFPLVKTAQVVTMPVPLNGGFQGLGQRGAAALWRAELVVMLKHAYSVSRTPKSFVM